MAATRWSSALRTATPVAGRAATRSDFSPATASRVPKASVWAALTAVTIATSGRASAARAAISPGAFVPISAISARSAPAAPSSVRGTPMLLLNDIGLACTGPATPSAAASRSFVDVLPTEPVMPTTVPAKRSRAAAPSCPSATSVSVTTTSGPASIPNPARRSRRARQPAAPAATASRRKS